MSLHPVTAKPSAMRIALVCCALLMLVTFSAPGREGPSSAGGLDLIALAKLGVRAVVVLALLWEIGQSWHDLARRHVMLGCLSPFGVYLAWALLTVVWSPMKVMSLGQWGSLFAQVLLAATIAMKWRSSKDTSRLLQHLSVALVVISGFIVAIHLYDQDLSGLDRESHEHEGSNGLVHPTSAGAIASLGIVMLSSCRVLWGWPWTRLMLIPGMLICSALLVMAHSRTAVAVTGGVLVLMTIAYSGRALAGIMLSLSLFGMVYLIYDPGLSLVDEANQELVAYARRGETDEQMSSLNGREALWDAIWAEFHHSPIVGHGYFMTSRSGILDVWSGPSVRTAHNVFLQVLVSTGLIGVGLFLWALGRPAWGMATKIPNHGEAGRVRALLLLTALWYLAWGQLCESFMGPVQPESVLFYGLLGLGVAHVGHTAEEGTQ